MRGTLTVDYNPQAQAGMPCKLGGTLFDKKNVKYSEFKVWVQDLKLCWAGALPSMHLLIMNYTVSASCYSAPYESHHDDESFQLFSASGEVPLPQTMMDWIEEFEGYQITIIMNVAECEVPEDPYKSCGKITSFRGYFRVSTNPVLP